LGQESRESQLPGPFRHEYTHPIRPNRIRRANIHSSARPRAAAEDIRKTMMGSIADQQRCEAAWHILLGPVERAMAEEKKEEADDHAGAHLRPVGR